MRFALNNKKIEATKGAKGLCPLCGSELVAKCGEVKVNHWAHKGNRNCDPWWENETDWHRLWKNYFPSEWQEVVHFDSTGEKHIADVKTESNWILEFQHSYLKPEERRSRNAFYKKIVWIVDGTRRQTDIKQFNEILKESRNLSKIPQTPLLCVHYPEECRLLKEWHDSNNNVFVFFDFHGVKEGDSWLWYPFPKITDTEAYLFRVSKYDLIAHHKNNKFDEAVEKVFNPTQNAIQAHIGSRKISYSSGFNGYRRMYRRPSRRF